MNTNLPTGGKSQSNSSSAQTQTTAATRIVRVERLQKLSIEQLEATVAALPTKLQKKSQIIERRITKLREGLAAYGDYCKRKEAECNRILAEKRKSVPAPNAGKPVRAA